jgi:hypothetical protein
MVEGIPKRLVPAGGGPHPPDMDGRVVRIEEWAKLADARMGRIEDKLDRMNERLSSMPTSTELFGYTASVAALAFAVVAIVAAIFAYRQDTLIALTDRAVQASQAPAAPLPIVIQIAPPPAATPTP